tara:strand:- start:12178 stop:14130 length:1953 start_codon:yes stop_codon:yes gene_type:complete
MHSQVVWEPSEGIIRNSNLFNFFDFINFSKKNYDELHAWSLENKGEFWNAIWDFTKVIGDKGDICFLENKDAWMTEAKFFPKARLNLAENLLRGKDERIAVIETDESENYKEYSLKEVKLMVRKISNGLKNVGVKPGDRVAAILPNRIESLVSLLATTSIGAVWTSCSPDFGTKAIIDRIGQTEPKVLFSTSKYIYAGKNHDFSSRLIEVSNSLKNLKMIVLSEENEIFHSKLECNFKTFNNFGEDRDFSYERVLFSDPSYILYTSGTTGAPKAIVHSVGGVILQHLKEHKIHCDIKVGDRAMWYTNIAWMMYHWIVSTMACESTLVLYDGAPIVNRKTFINYSLLWDVAEKTKLTHMGISPKYLSSLQDNNFFPNKNYDFNNLKWLMSAGSPVAPQQFDWVYNSIKSDMGFASISGGSELMGCFFLGSPMHSVRRGELTVKGLGMGVDIFNDKNDSIVGKPGDLVCTEPFPSMPVTFWGKDGDKRYKNTYFKERSEVWTHGDLAELTSYGSGIIYGRTDNTLNPGGVRIGTAEIYNICETFNEIEDCLVFGKKIKNDEEIVLCIKLRENCKLDNNFCREIRSIIKKNASPRHVPSKIYEVKDIPYTMNGKRVEGAARWILEGKDVPNLGSLSNPDCLKEYKLLYQKEAL